ncbi:MAG: hypothetical protein COA79_20555 [Planctomycetota bacterium]|nr:MAG: hypothetical protein COA79_20555 [Planctomycetota bacterium]
MKIITTIEISQKAKRTLIVDLLRSPFDGIYRALSQVLALTIAVDVFHASDFQKAIISGGPYLGLVSAIFLTRLFIKSNLTCNVLLSLINLSFAFCMLILYFNSNIVVYTYLISLGLAIIAVRPFVMTPILHNNYESSYRGKFYGYYFSLVSISTLLFIHYASQYYQNNQNNYSNIILVFVATGLCAAFIVYFFPKEKLPSKKSLDKSFLQILKDDPLFLKMLMIWFLFGFANLGINPLKVVFLMEEQYGFNYTLSQTTFLLGIIPAFTFLIFTPVMAHLFDKFNFIKLRILLNVFLGLSIITFFSIKNYYGFIASGILFGIGLAGGNIAWNLWITKLTTPEKSFSYMSIHQFMTGVRGVLGPLVYFYLVGLTSPLSMAFISFVLIFISVLFLIPLIKKGESFNN